MHESFHVCTLHSLLRRVFLQLALSGLRGDRDVCFVNGCSTPDWVPSDKAVSDKEREGGQEEVKSGDTVIERVTTGKTDGLGEMRAVELRGD